MKKSFYSILILSFIFSVYGFATDFSNKNGLAPGDYLRSFFSNNDYNVSLYNKDEQYIFAYKAIGTVRDVVNYDKLSISDKAVIYQFLDGKMNILLVVDGSRIYAKDKLLVEAKMPGKFYGWHIKIVEAPLKVYAQPFADNGKSTTDSIDFELNDNGEFEKIDYREIYKNQY